MKNLRLFSLLIACCLFSFISAAQSFNNFGTYSGSTDDDKSIVIKLQANGVASLTIDGNSDNVVEFNYVPSITNIIKFKAMPNAITVGEQIPTPIFRKGLFEQLNATQWRIQLNDFGQAEPAQFDGNAIILDFVP